MENGARGLIWFVTSRAVMEPQRRRARALTPPPSMAGRTVMALTIYAWHVSCIVALVRIYLVQLYF